MIVELTTASPGVIRELALIAELSRNQDAILVLPSADTTRSLQSHREIIAIYTGTAAAGGGEIIKAGDEALKGFPRIVSDASFGDAGPGDLAVFRGLLPDGPKLGLDEYCARRRDRLIGLRAAAQEYSEGDSRRSQRLYADAAAAFEASARAFDQFGDEAQQAMALNAAGRALMDASDVARAVQLLAAAAEIRRQTGPPADYIGSLHHLGLALLGTGDIAAAREVFQRMHGESAGWGYTRGAARALESLGMCALAEDDLAGAEEYLQQPRR